MISLVLAEQYRPASPEVDKKYRPLDKRTKDAINPANQDEVRAAATNRVDTFGNQDVNPGQLVYLSSENIAQIAALEAAKHPPLVVVSSNRSAWIKKCFENAQTILHGATHFTDVLDRDALKMGAVPFYLPSRLGTIEANRRNVYLFVGSEEYGTYKAALSGTNLKVVGWRTEGTNCLAGFGASRYAALEFFKKIHRHNQACAKIWMFDDNVVYIKKFPGFVKAEDDLQGTFGLGFMGCKTLTTDAAFRNNLYGKPNGNPTADMPVTAPFLQQAVLWNVGLFQEKGYSFSPYFITAGEDISLTNFLKHLTPPSPNPCLQYKSCDLLKGQPTNDYSTGERKLQHYRNQLVIACYESGNDVSCTCQGMNGTPTLAEVIYALRQDPNYPNWPPRIPTVAANETLEQTYSKALEQLLTLALEKGLQLPDNVFALGEPNIQLKIV